VLGGALGSRGEERKALAREARFRARRWVVERTPSWLNSYRAILVRWSNATSGVLSASDGWRSPCNELNPDAGTLGVPQTLVE